MITVHQLPSTVSLWINPTRIPSSGISLAALIPIQRTATVSARQTKRRQEKFPRKTNKGSENRDPTTIILQNLMHINLSFN
jgi:hypothetical protein